MKPAVETPQPALLQSSVSHSLHQRQQLLSLSLSHSPHFARSLIASAASSTPHSHIYYLHCRRRRRRDHPSIRRRRAFPSLPFSLPRISPLDQDTNTHTHAADSFSLALSLAHRSQVAVDRSRHLLTARLSLTRSHTFSLCRRRVSPFRSRRLRVSCVRRRGSCDVDAVIVVVVLHV